jgi:hypothetical protein
MKTNYLILAAATLLISGGVASAQMQYDSLGSPTPAPNQSASPNATAPNVPNTGGVSSKAKGDGAKSTTGSGAVNGGVNGPINNGTSTPTDPMRSDVTTEPPGGVKANGKVNTGKEPTPPGRLTDD